MKVLYGVCGEGLGHASRSRILIHYLQQQNHDVRIIAGGKAYKILSEEFDEVVEVVSPKVFYTHNQVRVFYTFFYTLYQTIVHTPVSFFKVRKIIKELQPDLLITDAEPISHLAARLSNIKRISIDNPSALLYRNYTVKKWEYFSWFFLFFALKFSLLGADKYIIYDFFDEQINNPRVLFLKPLIQSGLRRQTLISGEHIFVYQTSLSFPSLFTSLKKFNETFIIYGYNKEMTDKNLIFKRFNEDVFYKDIASSKAVIVNGGFTVISEALFLRKPIFSIPIRFQFEQVFNARCVERIGAGVSHKIFFEEDFSQFLLNLNSFQENLQKYDAGNQDEILKRIEQEIRNVFIEKK